MPGDVRAAVASAGACAGEFPATKSFDTFDFTAIPGLNKMLVLEHLRQVPALQRRRLVQRVRLLLDQRQVGPVTS